MRRLLAGALIAVLVLFGLLERNAAAAPVTVSTVGLPTVQVQGVVWAQVTVGRVVYATGRFTKVRAAGSAPGVGETTRGNLLAFNIDSGGLLPFNHSLNGEGKAVAVSKDGKTLFVGGLFTAVDGVPRSHLAAFSVATGALLSTYATGPNGKVLALTTSPDGRLYVGGGFSTIGGKTHLNVAAYAPAGVVASTWTGKANSTVAALIVSPSGDKLILGGSFNIVGNSVINVGGTGQSDHGLGALGVNDPGEAFGLSSWVPNLDSFPIQNDDVVNSGRGITSLSTDGVQIFGSSFNFITGATYGSFEGTFAISQVNGALNWMDPCHGDTYSTFVVGGVLYSAGHAHDCLAIGGFAQTDPMTWHRGLAETVTVDGVAQCGVAPYFCYAGYPRSSLLPWFPDFNVGYASGAFQGPWSVTGTADGSVVSYAGEFTKVNGRAQQGLVRFKRG